MEELWVYVAALAMFYSFPPMVFGAYWRQDVTCAVAAYLLPSSYHSVCRTTRTAAAAAIKKKRGKKKKGENNTIDLLYIYVYMKWEKNWLFFLLEKCFYQSPVKKRIKNRSQSKTYTIFIFYFSVRIQYPSWKSATVPLFSIFLYFSQIVIAITKKIHWKKFKKNLFFK